MVGHGGSSAGSYFADPTSPIPSRCASVVVTSTLRVNIHIQQCSFVWLCMAVVTSPIFNILYVSVTLLLAKNTVKTFAENNESIFKQHEMKRAEHRCTQKCTLLAHIIMLSYRVTTAHPPRLCNKKH